MFSRGAIERRLGIPDSRGPQGMFSRGANVYRGGLPNAQAGTGNPNIGRPAIGQGAGVMNAPMGVTPSPTTMVGSLPPLAGNSDSTMNAAVMNLLKSRLSRGVGYAT
jgi:hypothetical protein